MLQREVEIVNKLGLHARASAKLTQVAGRFESDVWLSRNGRRVNAKSIMEVLTAGVDQGSRIELTADGDDAEEAVHVLSTLIEGELRAS